MEIEYIYHNVKYYAYEYSVYAGRYAGEPIAATKDKRHWKIKDIHICQKNVAKFLVKEWKACYYFRCPGAKVQIVWRDGSESWIMLPPAAVKYITKALKWDKTPY